MESGKDGKLRRSQDNSCLNHIFREKVRCGEPATLTCSIPSYVSEAVVSGEAHVLWKGPLGNIVLPGISSIETEAFFNFFTNKIFQNLGNKYSVRLVTTDDPNEKLKASTLALVDCNETDAGSYTCSVVVAVNNDTLFSSTAHLEILRNFFSLR